MRIRAANDPDAGMPSGLSPRQEAMWRDRQAQTKKMEKEMAEQATMDRQKARRRRTPVPPPPVSAALVGTWTSGNAWVIECCQGATTWQLHKNGTYRITADGRSETGHWGVVHAAEGDQLVRYKSTYHGQGGIGVELQAHDRQFVYGGGGMSSRVFRKR